MKKSLLIGRSLLALAFSISTSTTGWAGQAKFSAELQKPRPGRNLDVIVQYRKTPTAAHRARVAAAGGSVLHTWDALRTDHYSIQSSQLQTLADDPDVAYISPNRPLQGMMDIPAQTVNDQAAMTAGYDGTGIGVAVIDSGIATLNDFASQQNRIVFQASFVGGSPIDQWGHGTHVAGLIGSDGNGTVYTGIVPNVNLINLRALDQNGNGTDASVIAAINAAIQLQSKYNIRVINMSLGRPVFEPAAQDPLCQAVEAAWQAGIVVVVAAGNQGRNNSAGPQGYGTIAAPGNDPDVITVGAMKDMGTSTRADDLIASYSSKGPTAFDHYVKPDILAPGNLVVSTMTAKMTLATPQNQVANNEYILSGTSMATPLVSGAAVALIQQNPSLTPDQVKARLMKTASKNFPVSSVAVDPTTGIAYTDYYDIFTVGAGYLNIAAALSDASLASGPALSPSASVNPATGQIVLSGVKGQNVVWGANAFWSPGVIWGSAVVAGSQVVWGSAVAAGSNVVWGANVPGAASIPWASGAMQGFNVVWGQNVVWGASTTDASESSNIALYGER